MRQTLSETRDTHSRPLAEAQLAEVLEGVHDGVILSVAGRATPNAAARRMLGIGEDDGFHERELLAAHARR